MKVFFLHIILLFLLSGSGYSQENTPLPPSTPPPTQYPVAPKEFSSFKERLFFGGNVGAWFGSTTYINLSPLVGCKITKQFSLGAGFTYNYYSQTYMGQKYTSTIYGSNTFARYLILENVFAQIGWDRLSVSDYTSIIPNSRVWIDNILVGGGFRQPFSERGSFVAAIFYNINQTPLTPYPNPIIQVGFNIGL
ncbi:MAG: hypothetical protein K0S53_1624 [Bacteroidetes bacterium]|jgi:hypothetical protein|nr:hypothetical protein [Bacteroidota bacterium]